MIASLACRPTAASAQLLSPGRLAEAHAELEGLRGCTECHQLGKRGIDPERCLGCHETLRMRVRASLGYHAAADHEACADCHQDHLGRDFDLLHLDERTFDHDKAGYSLERAHADVVCRSCHAPDHVVDPAVRAARSSDAALARTFLGLGTECTGCHAEDDPHGDQFGSRACSTCHEPDRWEVPTRFDHTATAYPLQGRHAGVACSECHGPVERAVYTPLDHGDCADCHATPHGAAIRGACADCHDTRGWGGAGSSLASGAVDHGRTAFPLRGAHATAECATCHRTGAPLRTELLRISYRRGTASRSLPIPESRTCSSCHVDRHAFAGSGSRWLGCADCHDEGAWAPSRFTQASHADADFPLAGAHAAVPCLACHVDPTGSPGRFHLAVEGRACLDCHREADPHEGRFEPLPCEACHDTEAFDRATLDHALPAVTSRTCASCHAQDDPHGGQFPDRACSSCHGTAGFTILDFDHGTTRFALDGAHSAARCDACHVPDERGTLLYRPLGTECTDCHGGIT